MTDPTQDLVRAFEAERPHLFGIAYRMLGSAAEAEDVLQDAFLRFAAHEGDVANARALLTTIVVRLSLDQLKSARVRRETYVGPWLPEPLVSSAALPPVASPDARTELAESLSLAFLVLLERLSPLERAAFLMREVFDHSFEEVASALGTNEVACRKLVTRARAHVDANRPRFTATEAKKNELLAAFMGACASGDPEALGRVLSADVVARSDGGGKVHAALKPVFGRDRVVRFLLGVLKKAPPRGVPSIVRINGSPGVVICDEAGVLVSALTLSVAGDEITDVWIVQNPDKLRAPSAGRVS